MKRNTMRILANCCNQIVENKKRNDARALYQQALAESKEVEKVDSWQYKGIWKFPKVEGNLSYHTSWGSEDCSIIVNKIQELLTRLELSCDIRKCVQGTTVSRFYLMPHGKTKVTSVLRLEDDFKVALNNSGVSLGIDDGALVIDVPRECREVVYFGDLIRNEMFQEKPNTALAIGMDIELNPVIYDLREAIHILVAGQTGSGKSVLIHNLIASLLMKNTPNDMHLHIIDPKMLEFSKYASLPLCTVTTEVSLATRLLEELCVEMDNRYAILAKTGNRDIDSYNESHLDSIMRREVVIIDELADLMNQCGKTVESCIVRLAQKARACGIHLILATQYPVHTVVTGLIKQNLPTRICLSVSSSIASMVALDMKGGENLSGNGDMLFLANGAQKPIRLQGGYISEMEIDNIVYALCLNLKLNS